MSSDSEENTEDHPPSPDIDQQADNSEGEPCTSAQAIESSAPSRRRPRQSAGSDEPPSKLCKVSSDDETGKNCLICTEPWTNSGQHRVVALKCGHLFGLKCVERWLHSNPIKERSCPKCKAKATTREIRYVYSRKLVPTNSSQITLLQKQLDKLAEEKRRVELELEQRKQHHRENYQQLEALKELMKSEVNKELPARELEIRDREESDGD